MTERNRSIPEDMMERAVAYDRFVRGPSMQMALAAAAASLGRKLGPDAPLAVQDLPCADLPVAPPEGVALVKVAVMAPGFTGPVERHPNTDQWLFSLTGAGCARVWRGEWAEDPFGGEAEAVAARWHLVRAGEWHQTEAGAGENWAVAAVLGAAAVETDLAEGAADAPPAP